MELSITDRSSSLASGSDSVPPPSTERIETGPSDDELTQSMSLKLRNWMSYYDMFLYGSGSRRNSFSPYVRWIWIAIAFVWLAGQTVYLVVLYLRGLELYVDVTDFIYYVLTCALIWNNASWGHNHLDSIFDKMLEMPGVRHRVLSLFVVRLLSAVVGIGVVTSVVCMDIVETLDSQGLDIGLLLLGYLPWYGAYVHAYASFFDLCGIFVWCLYIQFFSFVSQVSVAGVRRYCSGERRKLEEVLEDICMDHSDVTSYLNNTWGFNSVIRALFTIVSVFQLNIILASLAEVEDTRQKILAIRCAALFCYVWMCACFLAAGFLNDVGDMTCTKFYIESVSEGAFDGDRVVCEDGDAGSDGRDNNIYWSKSRRGKVDSHMLVLIERLTKRTKVANIVVSRATASAIVTLTFSIVHFLVQWNLLD